MHSKEENSSRSIVVVLGSSCYYYILKRMDGLFLKMPSTMVRNIKKAVCMFVTEEI